MKKEKLSIGKYGGYYIGRYEVGNEDNTAVIKAEQEPYTDIYWYQSYELAKGIGGGKGATTYLCSSYAWDTAINFIQNNGLRPDGTKAIDYATSTENYNENWNGKMHQKSAVFDEEYTIIASTNWTGASEYANDENMLIIKNKDIAAKQTKEFFRLWKSIPDKFLYEIPNFASKKLE